jgi:hypothetical protein
MKSSLKIILFIFLIISCNERSNDNIIINSPHGIKKEISQIENGYVIKEFLNDLPHGRHIYCDNDNFIKRIEWYTYNQSPYYTVEREKNSTYAIYKENYSVLNMNYLKIPQMSITNYGDNTAELNLRFSSPIEKTLVTFYDLMLAGHTTSLFENSVLYYFDNLKFKKTIYLKFDFEGEGGKIIKTIDSVKVDL